MLPRRRRLPEDLPQFLGDRQAADAVWLHCYEVGSDVALLQADGLLVNPMAPCYPVDYSFRSKPRWFTGSGEDLFYLLNHPLHTFFIVPPDPGHHLQRRRGHRSKRTMPLPHIHFPGIARIIDQDAGSGDLLLRGDYFESEEGKYPPAVRLGGYRKDP